MRVPFLSRLRRARRQDIGAANMRRVVLACSLFALPIFEGAFHCCGERSFSLLALFGGWGYFPDRSADPSALLAVVGLQVRRRPQIFWGHASRGLRSVVAFGDQSGDVGIYLSFNPSV